MILQFQLIYLIYFFIIIKQSDCPMDNEAQSAKWTNFYFRLRKQYMDGKPFTYELDLTSNQPKPRAAKFMIMIQKFITIFKWGLRETYNNEDQRRENYWTELSKYFHNDVEMGFLNEGYWEKPQHKIKKYFALLIHTKRIFKVLEETINKMSYLFQNQEQKRKNYQDEIKNLNFLEDGNYKVMGELITSYEQYAENRREIQKIKQIQRLQQEKLRIQQERKRVQKQKQEEEQKKQKARKEEEAERKRKEIEEKMLKKQKQEQQSRLLITSDYFPSNYKEAFKTPNNVMRKDPSNAALILPNNLQHERKMKNSEKLFRERFKQQLDVFAYTLKPEAEEDKNICFACKANLKQGIYKLGGNQNYCYYSGKWYCNGDISQQRMPIPWKAIEKFDLKGYTVSKVAYAQLKAFYQKPIIEIKKDNPITRENKIFHDFLIVKKQIHLMYDSICNLDIIEPLLRKKENYCLKMYLFSMKNLYDIYNGQQTGKLQKDYEILSKHFYRCDICQKKKGYICPICKDPVKIFPFEIKDTFGCIPCRKLYHRKCVPSGMCKCKEEE